MSKTRLEKLQNRRSLTPAERLELEQLLHQQMANEMRMPEGVTAPETEQLFDAEPFDEEPFDSEDSQENG